MTTTSSCSAYMRPDAVAPDVRGELGLAGQLAAGGDGVRDQVDARLEHAVGDAGRLPVQRDLLGELDVARHGDELGGHELRARKRR